MRSIQGTNEMHGITIKVFDNADSYLVKKEISTNRRPSIDSTNQNGEKKKNLLQTFNDGDKINIKGNNILGISYSTMENNLAKKKTGRK